MELTKIAPPTADIKRFEDNNATVSAFVSGQVQADRHRRLGGRQHDGHATRSSAPSTSCCIKDSPNFIGVAKGEDKLRLKVNEIIAAAKAAGDLDKMADEVARPTGRRPALNWPART